MCAPGTAKCSLTSPTKGFKYLFDLCPGSQLFWCWGCYQCNENSSGCLFKPSSIDKDVLTVCCTPWLVSQHSESWTLAGDESIGKRLLFVCGLHIQHRSAVTAADVDVERLVVQIVVVRTARLSHPCKPFAVCGFGSRRE